MEPRYLLDTNICIYIRQEKPAELMQRFRRLGPGQTAISVITYGELFYGAQKSARGTAAVDKLRELVTFLPVLPLPEVAADWYGRIRSDLERKGALIGNNDLWIAAHALAANLILVTNDEDEFRRVPGVRIQNWTTGES